MRGRPMKASSKTWPATRCLGGRERRCRELLNLSSERVSGCPLVTVGYGGRECVGKFAQMTEECVTGHPRHGDRPLRGLVAEPTNGLREACDLAARPLAAQRAPIIALTALAALGLSGDPVHEPVHDRGPGIPSSCYCA
jgi:hypothetical protein